MKIALFHEVVSGGARRGANEFARTLKALGHSVDLYVVDIKYPQEEEEYYDKIFYYQFVPKYWKGKNWGVKLYKDTVELFRLYTLHGQIAKDISQKTYDFSFVHPSQYTQAPFLLRFLSLPKVYYCQEPLRMIYEKELDTTNQLGFFKKRYERVMRKVRKKIDRKNISFADVILANSIFTQKNIHSAYELGSYVCYMGVDRKRFYEEKVKKDIAILYIGSEDALDGYDLFQASLSFLRSKPKIEYLLRGKKWLSDDGELRRYYSRSRIVICFGKKEPFGLIPLEAGSCGSVVVALDAGGYRDSVKNGKTGILVSENPQKIADSIDTLLKNEYLLKSLSKNAKENIRDNWSWRNSATTLLKQYDIWKKNH